MKTYKDWICRYYSEHEDGEPDGEIIQELIRCKDCKYYEEQDETIGTCLLTESGAHIEGYCSWGEVKEE